MYVCMSEECTREKCSAARGDKCLVGRCVRDCSQFDQCADGTTSHEEADDDDLSVCASDGRTYSSECAMNAAACQLNMKLTVARTGKCSANVKSTQGT